MNIDATDYIEIARAKMKKDIAEEILEFTGEELEFEFTNNLFYINGFLWHEYLVKDTNTLMYAKINEYQNTVTVVEKEEMETE